MTKLFQSPCLPSEMAKSLDATYRTGDDRIPVSGTLQYRWGRGMQDTMPSREQKIVSGETGKFTRPKTEDGYPFYMTGGTKRSHTGG